MKKFLAALATSALLLVVLAPLAYPQDGTRYPMLITKQARWQTWGPNGPVGTPTDTTMLDNAAVDTTGAIYIGDLAWESLATGIATSANTVIRVQITGSGNADDLDSLYYHVDVSPDGIHWQTPTASQILNFSNGVVAGVDQGNAAAGTTVNNCLNFALRYDNDVQSIGATAALNAVSWGFTPYIRLHIRSQASDVFKAARCMVSYVAYREGPSQPVYPTLVTKQARWQTWGPNGEVGASADTSMFDGAMQDTTEAIDIRDYAWVGGSVSTGPGAFAIQGGLKVHIVGNAVMDNVDSLYYRIESSPDGAHWSQIPAAENLNFMIGTVCGFDQGNAAAGTTVNNVATILVNVDNDVLEAGTSAATFNSVWGFSPFIRLIIRTQASDVMKAARLFVSYPGYRESR